MIARALHIEDGLLEVISGFRALLRRVVIRNTREKGAVAAEYALILGLVAVVIVVAVAAFGTAVVSLFERTSGSIP